MHLIPVAVQLSHSVQLYAVQQSLSSKILHAQCRGQAQRSADVKSMSVCCSFKEMRESNQTMAEVALNLYRECLRKVLMQRGGYECQETEGSFMLSFYNCIDAVQFCILVSLQPQTLHSLRLQEN